MGEYGERELEIAAALTARYSAGKNLDCLEVEVQHNGATDSISVTPLTPEQIEPYRYRQLYRLISDERSLLVISENVHNMFYGGNPAILTLAAR